MDNCKNIIKELIQYYYNFNGAGGNCHIALDDGNLETSNLLWCRDQCMEHEDYLGCLIMETLLLFTTEEVDKMYDDKWWGMRK